MLSKVLLAVFALLVVAAVPACASGIDNKTFDQQSIDALVAKASQAQPRDQCFIYSEIVHEMTELSLRQYAAGDEAKAADLLKQIQGLAHKIHLSMSDDNKRLKNAEILLRHTAFRLTEMLHSSSFEDRTLVEQTLAQVNQAQNEAMMQVFRK
jgi:cell division septum initiation protein DivIVA